MKSAETGFDKKAYVSLYKKNTLCYALILLATALEFVYVVTVLDRMAISWIMGATVMVNIFLLFMLFTCAVKVNFYSAFWCWASLAAAAYVLLRVLVLVPFVIKPTGGETRILILNIASIALLAVAGVIGLHRAKKRVALQDALHGSDG